jgi:enamine deaminase RidA (YjgF/YER057c/UK114 family)
MAGRIEARMIELGVELPRPAVPAANYVPWVRAGELVFIAGQVPFWNGELRYRGKVGQELTLQDGRDAARLVVLNVLAQLRAACDGDLDRVRRCVKLGGFVNATPAFADHPQVLNGASDLLVDILGDVGRHTRTAVGVANLPFDVAVEIDAVFQVSP